MATPFNQHSSEYWARIAATQASAPTETSHEYSNNTNNGSHYAPATTMSHTPGHHLHRKPVPITRVVEKRSNSHRASTPKTSPINFFRNLSRRTRIFTAAGIIALLILIIGLAAGLSHSRSSSEDLPLPSSHGGPYTGDLTYYSPGLGACGITSANGDPIVAVSHLLYDAVQAGSNPNTNPLCGKKLRVLRDGRSVDLTVVDRCTGCAARDLDVTEDTFAELADVALGRVTVQWSWLEDVPA